MDFGTVLNRLKTRIRNYSFRDHWYKRILPEKLKHALSRSILKVLSSKTGKPAPYKAGEFPEGINL